MYLPSQEYCTLDLGKFLSRLTSPRALSGSPHLSVRATEQPSHRLPSMDINHRPYTLQPAKPQWGFRLVSRPSKSSQEVPPPDIPSIPPLIARSPAHITGRDQSGPEEAKQCSTGAHSPQTRAPLPRSPMGQRRVIHTII
jgi:hypothetical protein